MTNICIITKRPRLRICCRPLSLTYGIHWQTNNCNFLVIELQESLKQDQDYLRLLQQRTANSETLVRLNRSSRIFQGGRESLDADPNPRSCETVAGPAVLAVRRPK